jgi:STE24 endopeptidase
LVSALLAGALLIVQASPKLWWLWLWFFYFIFSLFMMYISPYVIEPLFNKFAPVDDAELSEKITQLLAKTGIKVSRVFKMDASKRSRHSNAYFTGIGRVKRIVLFDTLLNDMNHDEILSVLAHEAGHWKKKHILKSIIVSEVVSIAVFFIASYIFSTDWLVKIFNLSHDSFLAKMVLLGFIGGLAGFFISPLSAYFSRRNERQADDYAKELMGTSEGLKSALKKLSKDNLSNLYPHPLFVLFHYSHPPILSRLARM